MTTTEAKPIRILVLISGAGSNLQAIIDATCAGQLPIEIAAVISNRPDAAGLTKAARAGIATRVVDHRDYAERQHFDAELGRICSAEKVGLVVLAGFMRILGADLVRAHAGRILNIHPSLLPRHRGLDTHRRAIAAGDKIHGASVHFVIPALDAGPVIIRGEVPVKPNDTPDALARRVQAIEHRIYPQAIGWFAAGALKLDGDRVRFNGQPLPPEGKLYQEGGTHGS